MEFQRCQLLKWHSILQLPIHCQPGSARYWKEARLGNLAYRGKRYLRGGSEFCYGCHLTLPAFCVSA